MTRRTLSAALLTALAALAVVAVLPAPATGQPAGGRMIPAWPDLKFVKPLGIVAAPDQSDVLYVQEQAGRILAVPKWRGSGPAGPARPFLDISGKVFGRMQGGLLGLAFHPDYAQNGRVFVCYLAALGANGPFVIRVSEFRASGGVCRPDTERTIIEVQKNRPNHNAGCLAFGPDRMLYLSTGDDQTEEQAVTTSQNPMSLLGKVLRIDVSNASVPYEIPGDNPWASYQQGVRREIFAYGLRNPWQIAFDPRGNLWSAEPGTNAIPREWIVRIQKGGNHGWPYKCGSADWVPTPPNLSAASFVPPVFEYERQPGESMTAVVGGRLYHGTRLPGLQGKVVFADFGRGVVYAIDVTGGRGSNLQELGRVKDCAAIGEDAQGELYFCAFEEGVVYTLAP